MNGIAFPHQVFSSLSLFAYSLHSLQFESIYKHGTGQIPNNHLKSPFTTTFSLKLLFYFVSLAGKKENFSLQAAKKIEREIEIIRERERKEEWKREKKWNIQDVTSEIQAFKKEKTNRHHPLSIFFLSFSLSSSSFFLSLALHLFCSSLSWKALCFTWYVSSPIYSTAESKVESFYPTSSSNDGLLILWNLEQFRRELLPSTVKAYLAFICELLLFINSWERFHTIRSNLFLEEIHVSFYSLPFVAVDTKIWLTINHTGKCIIVLLWSNHSCKSGKNPFTLIVSSENSIVNWKEKESKSERREK